MSAHSHPSGGPYARHPHRQAHASLRRHRGGAGARSRDRRRRGRRPRRTQRLRQVHAHPAAAGPDQAHQRHRHGLRLAHLAPARLRLAHRRADREPRLRPVALGAHQPALSRAPARHLQRACRRGARDGRAAGSQQGAGEALLARHEAAARHRRGAAARSGAPRARRAHQRSRPGRRRRDPPAAPVARAIRDARSSSRRTCSARSRRPATRWP